MIEQTEPVYSTLALEVKKGLSAEPKFLPSKFFYDAEGDRLFREIMQLPEYYLTRSEYEIFSTHSASMAGLLPASRKVQLVELGPGDGLKSMLLLQAMADKKIEFDYFPVDISANTLDILEQNIRKKINAAISFRPLVAEYLEGLSQVPEESGAVRLILFMGSNIGNFTEEHTGSFVKKIAAYMCQEDMLLIGFDRMKDPQLILDAYNDSKGITRAFNLNLLQRINRELGADFDITGFGHFPVYDPVSGNCKSYLVSKKEQEVYIRYLDTSFHFSKDEPIFTEVSRKFNDRMIAALAEESALKIIADYRDCKHYFSDVILKRS